MSTAAARRYGRDVRRRGHLQASANWFGRVMRIVGASAVTSAEAMRALEQSLADRANGKRVPYKHPRQILHNGRKARR